MANTNGTTTTTHLAFVIDESGSMGGNVAPVVEGYNEFIDTLRGEGADNEKTRCTLAFFDSGGPYGDPNTRFRFDSVGLAEMPTLGNQDYNPRGGTPLNDAVSETIEKVGSRKGGDEKAMVVIITDGMENSSKTRTEDLRKLVESKVAEGWEFIYLGANVDAFAASSAIGMPGTPGSYFNFTSSRVGTAHAMSSAATRSSSYTNDSPEVFASVMSASDSLVDEDPAAYAAKEAAVKKVREEAKKREGSPAKSASDAAKRLLGKDKE